MQYVFKKLVYLIVFVKDLLVIYLNNIYHNIFWLHLVHKCLGEHWLHALPSYKKRSGAQWLSGRVLDSRTSGLRVRASPASLHCGPWAKHIYPSLVLVQPRKTRPCLTERLLMGRKESNQTNKQKTPEFHKFSITRGLCCHGNKSVHLNQGTKYVWVLVCVCSTVKTLLG